MIVASASQVKNAFGKYLDLARINGEVQIVRYGHVIAKIVGVNKIEEEPETEEVEDN